MDPSQVNGVGVGATHCARDQKGDSLPALCVLSVLFGQLPLPPFGVLMFPQHVFESGGFVSEAVKLTF